MLLGLKEVWFLL